MNEDNMSRRVLKTRREIYNAMLELLQTKPYSKITIQDIIDKAEIGRSTFYLHFETKDELLFSVIQYLFKSFSEKLPSFSDVPYSIPIKEIFTRIQVNHDLLCGIYKSTYGELLFTKFQEYWNQVITERIKNQPNQYQQPDVPLELYVNHITGSVMNMLKWWLANDSSISPEKMEQYWHSLIN